MLNVAEELQRAGQDLIQAVASVTKPTARSDQHMWWQSGSVTLGFDFVTQQFGEKY